MIKFFLLLLAFSASKSEVVRQRRQTQGCFGGSNCNQNNFGPALGGFIPGGGFFPIGFGGGASQFCSGSNCNQNNFGGNFGGFFPGGGFAGFPLEVDLELLRIVLDPTAIKIMEESNVKLLQK